MDTSNIMDILKNIQAIIKSQPGLNVDCSIIDNRLNIIKQKVYEFENKNDFFYSMLIKLIGISLGEIYNRKFRNWIGLVLDKNEERIPQRTDIIFSRYNISDTIDKIEQADRDFSVKLFEYVCDILENNKDIMLDVETLTSLLDRDPNLYSSTLEGHYYYRLYNFSKLAKIIKANKTLEKSNISLDDVYQILIQTFQLNNEDVFVNLVKPEEFKKNHEAVNLALLECYANIFIEITNIIRKCLDKNFDRLAITKSRNNNFCEKMIIILLSSNIDEEDMDFINKILNDDDIKIDYNFHYSDKTLKEILTSNYNKIYIKHCN